MKAIIAEAAHERIQSERPWYGRSWTRWAAAMAAAVLVFVILSVLPLGRLGHANAAAATLLAQSARAMSELQTVHMIGRMRAVPGDNFEFVGAKLDFIPLELWREYSNPPRWRVEKPGRVVVMDGQSSTLYISEGKMAATGTPRAGFVEWLRPLLSPETILEQEQAAARLGTANATLSEADGQLVLTVQRDARGDFSNDWARNMSISESNHTCVYTFDADTKRLEGLKVTVQVGGQDVTVLELTTVRYNEAFPPGLFSLPLPSDVNWYVDPASLKPPSTELTGPQDAASYFFDALAREDWNAVLEVYPYSRVDDLVKRVYGGLQVVSLGQPFQSGLYPGFFVPYKIRLRSGSTKKWNLAVRNDNPAARWVVDGGF
jgi:outer membrane lipoprotein-sorting protein